MIRPLVHTAELDPAWANLRTEDIRFSRAGDRLAVAATDGRILLFAIEPEARPVLISNTASIVSPTLRNPHGLDFVTDDLLVVANRLGAITFHRIPPLHRWEPEMTVDACDRFDSDLFGRDGEMRLLRARHVACGPGSVRRHGDQLVVACNNRNTVSVHSFSLRGGELRIEPTHDLVGSGAEIPDGVAVSADGQWAAVSDHDRRRVLVHRLDTKALSCVLRAPGLAHPHGLCFDQSGRRLIVADAGGRQLHVFVSHDGWARNQTSSALVVDAVSRTAFDRTLDATAEEHRSLEGGVKGLDIHPSGTILATTCRNQTLRFFEIAPAMSSAPAASIPHTTVS